MHRAHKNDGYTLVELVIGLAVFAVIATSIYGLFMALTRSAVIAKHRAVASTLATNQMEYLKSLPYNSLAVAGGSIISTNPLPATATQTLNNVTYTITTSINYVDDAYDGCANYPNLQLKQKYCRNYPAPSGAPATDTNPQDYKIIHVSVTDRHAAKLAAVDSQVAARVAETASTTGALFVTVIDDNGNPVSGATVAVANASIAPNISVSDTTDNYGTAVFYGLPPDTTAYHYAITASNNGYSTLTTIPPAGALQPNYPNQRIFTQQSSLVTLSISPQGSDSLLVETTGVTGIQLAGAKIYVKGGYKKYTAPADTSYYFDNLTPTDTRITTDSNGNGTLSDLAPGDYLFCGDVGATSCSIGGTAYYLAAAVPYVGSNSLEPIGIPTFLASSPPAQTFNFNGKDYLQKVRLMLTPISNFPRVLSMTPSDASQSSNLSSFAFSLSGANLPSNASVQFATAGFTYAASCTGATGTQLDCTANLSSAPLGVLQLSVTANGHTLTLPTTPLLGGLNVTT